MVKALPTVDEAFLDDLKVRMAETAREGGGVKGWASDNDVALDDLVAFCRSLGVQAAEGDDGPVTTLMVAAQAGYETRRAQAEGELLRSAQRFIDGHEDRFERTQRARILGDFLNHDFRGVD